MTPAGELRTWEWHGETAQQEDVEASVRVADGRCRRDDETVRSDSGARLVETNAANARIRIFEQMLNNTLTQGHVSCIYHCA